MGMENMEYISQTNNIKTRITIYVIIAVAFCLLLGFGCFNKPSLENDEPIFLENISIDSAITTMGVFGVDHYDINTNDCLIQFGKNDGLCVVGITINNTHYTMKHVCRFNDRTCDLISYNKEF
jgi:hypothetical protein